MVEVRAGCKGLEADGGHGARVTLRRSPCADHLGNVGGVRTGHLGEQALTMAPHAAQVRAVPALGGPRQAIALELGGEVGDARVRRHPVEVVAVAALVGALGARDVVQVAADHHGERVASYVDDRGPGARRAQVAASSEDAQVAGPIGQEGHVADILREKQALQLEREHEARLVVRCEDQARRRLGAEVEREQKKRHSGGGDGPAGHSGLNTSSTRRCHRREREKGEIATFS
eukprot:831948-Prymnesium_polylepis.1